MNRIPIHSILAAVAKSFGVSIRQMRGTSHRFDIVMARACYAKISVSMGFTSDFVAKLICKTKAMISLYLKRHETYLSIAEYQYYYDRLKNYGEAKF